MIMKKKMLICGGLNVMQLKLSTMGLLFFLKDKGLLNIDLDESKAFDLMSDFREWCEQERSIEEIMELIGSGDIKK